MSLLKNGKPVKQRQDLYKLSDFYHYKMNISDLEPRQGNVEVIGEITEIGQTREFQKFGRSGRVATAILKDETGEIKLSLWNEQIDEFKAGDKVRIENGYVNEWQGEKQLTTGKFGKIEKIEMQAGEKKSPKKTSKKKASSKELESDKGSHILSDDEATEEEVLGNELGKPAIQDSTTHDEETEAEALEGEEQVNNLEAETDAEMQEENIEVEEEEIK